MILIGHKKTQGAQFFCASLWLINLLFLATSTFTAEIKTPDVLDTDLEFTLVASEPDIVTPTGCAVDAHGRLFVIESHTHFPPKNYAGPKLDRIKIFEDTNRDGKFDKTTIFADDIRWGMSLAFSPEGVLHLTHRNGVVRMEDTDGDGKCDKRTEILRLETKGNYPHNGLDCIAFGPRDTLYVGTGENLGAPYTLVGSDGSQFTNPGGDSAHIFSCRRDGSKLELFARGGWNFFGLECDAAGNLFAVDNDPDSRPPCRLLHIIEGGNYGFEYRHGRNGLSPFTAWNGELPGTLPMIAGTGEAPSAVMDTRRAKLPARFANALLVTSWGDHDLEIFRLSQRGVSFTSRREVIVQGDADFRPVALAAAPDGSVFVTDWVKQSYELHGHGRIWKLSAKKGAALAKHPTPVALKQPSLSNLRVIRKALGSNDLFVRAAAVTTLAKSMTMEQLTKEFDSNDASVRLGALLALRKSYPSPASAGESQREGILRRALADTDEYVRLVALQWIGDEKLAALADDLPKALKGNISPKLFEVHAETVAVLTKKGEAAPAGDEIRIFELEKVVQASSPPAKGEVPVPLPTEKRPTTDDEWRAALDVLRGDAEAGRKVYFRATTQCGTCHRIEGRGGQIGPDLTYIAYAADREKLLRSILQPSRDIAPQFATHEVETKDGQSFSGRLVKQTSDALTLYTIDGKGVFIPKSQIIAQKQSKISLMPENLTDGMSAQDVRDLLEFLLLKR